MTLVGQARHVAVVGAGFSGAVVARELAEAGHRIDVFDERDHVGGNSHTARDETGVMVHVYGPHIFHTANERVWEYVQRFGVMEPYSHRVKATVHGKVYSLPINLLTINQFFDRAMSPAEARTFIAELGEQTDEVPTTFEQQGLRFVGRALYEAFFAGYTRKQWGLDPAELPASVLARLPVRFSYNDSYFDHPHQAIPRDGYTAIVAAMLDHPNVRVHLGTAVDRAALTDVDHTFWSGPIDRYLDHGFGRLPYRTLDFEVSRTTGDHQGCPVMNYCDAEVAYTRVTEHQHFAPWESHAESVVYTEFSRSCGPDDVPYYPIRLARDQAQLAEYVAAAEQLEGITFLGRLGTYRYLDMDVTIAEALTCADAVKTAWAEGRPAPVFSVRPI